MSTGCTIWTVGHSTRTAGEFVAVLQSHGIEMIADVRRFPGSRRHPHFGGAVLAQSLEDHGIGYMWLSQLGGRRSGPTAVQHAGWRNSSFRAYAGYTWSEEFAQGLEELLNIAHGQRTALMCSELLWWRCHRALVADALRFTGFEVLHLAREGSPGTPHPYTSPARVVEGELHYPADECC